jgi:hypothetical protein
MGGVAIGEKLGAAPKSEQHLAKLVTQNDIMIGLFRRVVAKAADERAYLASMRGPGGGFE